MQDSLLHTPNLAQRLFHQNELGLKTESLAARFAAKEALAKAIGDPRLLIWAEIEVEKDENGKPVFVFHGDTKTKLSEAGVKATHLSLSHDAGVAAAVVVLEA
jgi:holo-[acyl-carrier protein] synthase